MHPQRPEYVPVTASTGLERGEVRVQFLYRHHTLFRASAQPGAITRKYCYFCHLSPRWLIKTLKCNLSTAYKKVKQYLPTTKHDSAP